MMFFTVVIILPDSQLFKWFCCLTLVIVSLFWCHNVSLKPGCQLACKSFIISVGGLRSCWGKVLPKIPFDLTSRCETKQNWCQDLPSASPSNRMSTPPASGHAPKGASQPHFQLASSFLTRLLIVACAGREQSRICWWGRRGWRRERKKEDKKTFPPALLNVILKFLLYYCIDITFGSCLKH